MARMKMVNGVISQMTAEEEARLEADFEASDLDFGRVRSERNSFLNGCDWTQLGDAALGDHTAEDCQPYRQALRDLPANYSRVSEVVWPTPPE